MLGTGGNTDEFTITPVCLRVAPMYADRSDAAGSKRSRSASETRRAASPFLGFIPLRLRNDSEGCEGSSSNGTTTSGSEDVLKDLCQHFM